MNIDVWGIGHCCQDNICIVEHYPQEDGSTHILNIDDSQGGGAAATAMVAASRLGAAAGIIANLGDDGVGDRILRGFAQEGVNTALVRRIPGGRSSTSYVLVNPDNGSRTKFPYRDSLPDITFTREIRTALSGARVLHLDGTQYANALRAARLARELGVAVSLDACSMQADNGKNWELAGLADILITNERYPCRLTGIQDLESALLEMYRVLSCGGQVSGAAAHGEFPNAPAVLAATAGNRGCYYIADGRVRHMPAFPVKAVDTTGAGDTFHGAFLAHWIRGSCLEDCLRFAAAAAALKCMKYGGRAGIPDHRAVEAFLMKVAMENNIH